MSSNARKGSPTRSSNTGVANKRTTKARVFVFLTLVILTAVFSANALTANASAATTGTAQSQSGFIASSFNNILSFFGIAEAATPAADKKLQDDVVKGCDTAPEGLLACYRADNNAADFTGVHDGAWRGSSIYATGKVGAGAFGFNGTNQVEVANTVALSPVNVTVDGWVNLSHTEGTFGVATKGESAYSLEVRGGQVFFVSRNAEGTVEELQAPSTIATSKWNHIAATHDGTTRIIYVNGEEVARGAQNGLYSGDAGDLVIGKTNTQIRGFLAQADEVKVFGRALTAEEIKNLSADRPDAPDAVVTVAPATITVTEATAGVVPITFTRGAGGAGGLMTLNFGGTGTLVNGAGCNAGNDGVTDSAVNWSPNQTVLVVNVTICNDTTPEPQETLTISIATLPGGDVDANGVAVDSTITVNDDDATVNIATVTAFGGGLEGTPGASGSFSFNVSRGTAQTFALPVSITLSGTADDGNPGINDYTVADGNCPGTAASHNTATNTITVTIPANSSNCSFTVNPVADARVEPNESVTATLTAPPVGYLNGPTNAQTASIINDDFAVVDFGTDPGTDDEGNPGAVGTFTFDFDRVVPANSQTEALTVTFTLAGTANGGAGCVGINGAPVDYTLAAVQSHGGTFNTANCTGTVTFAAGNNDAEVQFVSGADTKVEPDETMLGEVVLGPQTTNANRYTIGVDDTDTATIDDDDEDVTVGPANVGNANEGNPGPSGVLAFNFDRISDSSGESSIGGDPSDDALVVRFQLSGTASCNPAEYTVTSGSAGNNVALVDAANCIYTVDFNGETFLGVNDLNAVVNVTPIADNVPENNETVIVTILAGTGGNVYGVGNPNAAPAGTNTAFGTIVNDDVTVSIQVAPASVNEGNTVPAGDEGGVLTYTFTRLGEVAPGTTTCVNFSTSGVGASALTDYTVTFGAVSTCPNSFTPAAGISAGVVGIPGGLGAGFPVPPAVQQNSATVIVTPTDDDTVEPNEEVQVQVEAGTGYAPGPPATQASGLIVNDDSQSVNVIALVDTTLEGTTASGGNLTYRFCRVNGDNTNALTVVYNVSGFDTAPATTAAASANDIIAPPSFGNNVINIPAGQACTGAGTDLSIAASPDSTVEADDVVRVTVQDGTGYNAGLNVEGNLFDDGTILNDDNTVTCAITGASSVNENPTGNTITYTCTRVGGGLSGDASQSIAYTTNGASTATLTTDYTIAPATFTFGVGSATADVVVSTVGDTTPEADETVIINVATQTLGNGQTFTVLPASPASMTGTILNDDQTVAISGGGTVLENAGTSIRYDFTRNFGPTPPNALSGTLTVNFTVNVGNNAPEATAPNVAPGAANTPAGSNDCNGVANGGGNTGASDFTITAFSDNGLTVPATVTFNGGTCTGTISFPADDTIVSLLITPINDSVVELNENVVVAIAAATGGNVYTGTGTATGVIGNDDTNFAISVELGANPLVVNGTGVNAGDRGNSEGNANDLVDNSLTPHGSTAVFTVTRSGNLSGTQRIDVSTIPTGLLGEGTATSGAPGTACGAPGVDYITDGKTLEFLDGESVKLFFVAVCGDLLIEDDETIVAQLTNAQPSGVNPIGGSLNVPIATAEWDIFNDDSGFFFRANNASAAEGANVEFRVCLYTTASGNTLVSPALVGTPLTFDYTTLDNTATGNDYDTTFGDVTIPVGANCSDIIAVPTIDDAIFEGNETFFFDVTNTTPGTGVNGNLVPTPGSNTLVADVPPTNPVAAQTSRSVGTINDNDGASIFTISDRAQAEGNGGDGATTFNFPLTLTGQSANAQTICWITNSGDVTIANPVGGANPATPGFTASGAFDYTAIGEAPSNGVPNCFTFAANSTGTTVNIPVVVNGDLIPEPDQTFSVILGTVSGNTFTPLPDCPPSGSPTVTCAGTNPNHPGNINYNGIGIGTIQNDDAAVSVGITNVGTANNSTLETNSGTFAIPVTFNFSGAFEGNVVINYTVTPTTAPPAATVGSAGALPTPAFSGNPGTSTGAGACGAQTTLTAADLYAPSTAAAGGSGFSFAGTGFGGSTTTTVNLVGCGDTRPEANETFTVTITSVTGAPVFVAGATGCTTGNTSCGAKVGTIVDNDALGGFFFSGVNSGDVALAEGNPPATETPFDFNFTYSGTPADFQIVATLQTVDGTATAGTDYTSRTTAGGNACTVTFAAGSNVGTPSPSCRVLVTPDFVQEGDESFTVQVTGFATWGTSGGFAILGNNAAGTAILFNPATFGTNGNPAPVGTDLIAQGTILNDDGSRVFSVANLTQTEGTIDATDPASGIKNFVVRVEAQGSSTLQSQVSYVVQAHTSGDANTAPAVAGTSCATAENANSTDFISTAQTGNPFVTGNVITFNPNPSGNGGQGAGIEFVDIIVPVCADSRVELNDQFRVVLTSVSNASVAVGNNNQGIGTIVNDDGLTYQLSQTVININEGNTPGNGNASNATVTVSATGSSNLTTGATYTTVAGTATGGAACSNDATAAGATDYITTTAGPITAAQLLSGFNIQVPICGDTVPEANETFTIVITPGDGSPVLTVTVNIINDDGVLPPPTGIEGDIVDGQGGPAGDGLVTANDISRLREYLLGQGAPIGTPGDLTVNSQFRRADVNAVNNVACGNGQIDVGDLAVIREMILGVRPNNTPLCATARPEGDLNAERGENILRIIRAVNTTTAPGATVTVPFQIDSQGDETAIAFTANWNPAIFTFVSAELGSGAPVGHVLNTNTAGVAQGRLGVLIEPTNTNLFQQGPRQILRITFTVANGPNVAGTYPVTFTGTPVALGTSGAGGVLLGTTYEQGNIVVNPTAAGVTVSGRVTSAGGQGLRNATVVLTDSEGNRKTATTGSFGIYTFEDVDAGQTYVIGVSAKRFRFTSRVVNVTDSLADVNFVGQE